MVGKFVEQALPQASAQLPRSGVGLEPEFGASSIELPSPEFPHGVDETACHSSVLRNKMIQQLVSILATQSTGYHKFAYQSTYSNRTRNDNAWK